MGAQKKSSYARAILQLIFVVRSLDRVILRIAEVEHLRVSEQHSVLFVE